EDPEASLGEPRVDAEAPVHREILLERHDLGGDLGIELVSGEDRPVVVEGSDAAHLARRVVSRDETAVLERVEDRFSLGLGQCDAGTQARPEDALDASANPVEADVVEAASAGLLAEI